MSPSQFIVIFLIQLAGILAATRNLSRKCNNPSNPECLKRTHKVHHDATRVPEVATEIIDVIQNDAKQYSIAAPNLSRRCNNLLDPECVRSVAQEALPIVVIGTPELGTETLELIHIDARAFSVIGLDLTITDATISGLQDAEIKEISFDMEKKILKIIYETDIDLKCTFKGNGHLLNLPITGDGNLAIDLKNVYVEMLIPFDIIINKHGIDIIELKSYEFYYKVKGEVTFELTNLFNGNAESNFKIRTHVNDYWKKLTIQFGRPLLEEVNNKIFHVIKYLLLSLPLQDYIEN